MLKVHYICDKCGRTTSRGKRIKAQDMTAHTESVKGIEWIGDHIRLPFSNLDLCEKCWEEFLAWAKIEPKRSPI